MKFDDSIRPLVSVLVRSVLPAVLGALGAMVAVLAPIHFNAFCAGVPL